MSHPQHSPRDLSPCDCTTVDPATNLAFVKGCLRLMHSLEFFRSYKQRSLDLLQMSEGSRALEIGCGLGTDAVSMAARVGGTGLVVATDKSRALLAEAAGGAEAPDPLRFGAADVCNLPFRTGAFHAVRVDRTLQHVSHLDSAIPEMARVTAPGGIVVAIEPDWETLILDSNDLGTTRDVVQTFCDSMPNSRVGRTLRRRFLSAGLTDVEVWPETFTTADLDTGNEVFHLERTLRTCIDTGRLDEAAASRWYAGLADRDDATQFFGSLTLYIVRGRKPRLPDSRP